jgi:chromosome partitioning protein
MPLPPPKPPQARSPARTIALINQKGGVGKTTTTVNLAAAISLGSPEAPGSGGDRRGRRVLVVDLDPQAHATLHLGVETGADAPTVYDLLLDPAMDPAAALRPLGPNLAVLPAETDLAAIETELSGEEDRLRRLRAVLDRVQAGPAPFEFILIDCPPSLGLLTLNALAAAREIFIPMQAHFLALQGVGKLLETVSRVARSVNQRLHVTGVIVCMHDPSTTHSREVIADLDAFFEQARSREGEGEGDGPVPWRAARVYRPAIRRNIKLAECPSFGKTIFDYAPQCPGAADYRELAATIVGEWDRVLERRASPAPGARTEPSPAPAAAAAATIEGKPAPSAAPPVGGTAP